MVMNRNRVTMIINMVALTILFVGYFLTTGTRMLDSDGWKAFFRASSFLIMFVNLILDGRIKVKFVKAIIFTTFALFLSQSQIALNILFLIIVTISLHRLALNDLAITLFVPVVVLVVVHALLLSAGMINTEVQMVGERSRSSLGLSNANLVAIMYFSLALIATFLHIVIKKSISFVLAMISFAVAFFVIVPTDSRTSLLGVAVIATIYLINHYLHNSKLFKLLIAVGGLCAPVLATILSIYLIRAVDTELDIILSLRPYFFNQFVSAASVPDLIFGWASSDGVDNLFLMLLSGFGVIGLTVIVLFISARTFKMRVEFAPLVIALMVMSVFESFLVRPEIPSSVLFMSLLFSPFAQRIRQQKS